MSHESANCSPYPPAPRFGRILPKDMAPSATRCEPPGWQPPPAQMLLHRPVLVAGLLQRVLDCVREPVQHLEVAGLPALYVVGIALLVRQPDGWLHGSMWVPAKDGLDFVPIPPQALGVHPCPAGSSWLRAIVNAFGAELLEHLRTEGAARFNGNAIAKALASYLDSLHAWLWRQLRRHADLRAMRAKVARALALDPVTLQLARRVTWEVEQSPTQVSAHSWNIASVHQAALLQLERELPQALPLYGALLANNELIDHAPHEAVAVLRRYLLSQGLRPATWRLLTRCSARTLLAVRDAYSGPMSRAMIDHLLVLQAFQLSEPPPADIVDTIWGRHGRGRRRWAEYLTVFGGRQAVPFGHAIRCYAAQLELTAPGARDSLRDSMHAVVAWLDVTRTVISKNQRRAGWRWMVEQAMRWQAVQRAEQALGKPCWPVAEPKDSGTYRLYAVDSFAQLMEESLAMHHCVFDVRHDCAMGRAIVVSIRCRRDDRRVATAHYEREYGDINALPAVPGPRRWKLAQVRGVVNRDVPPSVLRAARTATAWLDDWSREQHEEELRAAAQQALDAEGDDVEGPRDADRVAQARPRPRVRLLTWFSRIYGRTLVSDDFVEPTRNAQVFGAVCSMELHSAADVEALMWRFEPIARALGMLVEADADVLRQRVQRGRLKRTRLKQLTDAIKSIDEGEPQYALKEWLHLAGERAMEACRQVVAAWLEEAPNMEEFEWFDGPTASAHGAAMSWFAKLSCQELEELGVRLNDGDYPGSSYNAAELNVGVEEANAAARRLGLGCRFR